MDKPIPLHDMAPPPPPRPPRPPRKVASLEHANLIDALGGNSVLASELGLTKQAVSIWRKRGIALRWRPKLAVMARAAGIPLPAKFFDPHS